MQGITDNQFKLFNVHVRVLLVRDSNKLKAMINYHTFLRLKGSSTLPSDLGAIKVIIFKAVFIDSNTFFHQRIL